MSKCPGWRGTLVSMCGTRPSRWRRCAPVCRRWSPCTTAFPSGSRSTSARLGVALVRLEGVSDAELLAVYRGAELVAIPSVMEGFGLPLLEALAAGTPVLAADIQPFRAAGDGVVRLAGSGDDAWAEALRSALDDRVWQASARRDGPLQAARFPWSACAAATLDVYREALARGGSSCSPRTR